MGTAPSRLQQRRVLVVDDDAIVRTWLSHSLENTEFFVAADVGTAESAAEAIERSRPALVLVDYRLPDGDGIELVRNLRAAGVDTPAVLMTAGTEAGLNQRALEAGFQGALVKSGSRDAVLAALRLVAAGEPAFDHRNAPRRYTDPSLEARDHEVLNLVTRGLTTRELAERTGIPPEEAQAAFRRASEKIQRRSRVKTLAAPPAALPPEPVAEPPARKTEAGLGYSERAAVLAAFLRSAGETVTLLEDEVARLETTVSGDTALPEQLVWHAHTLKGGAATAGLDDIATLAAQIEVTAFGGPRLAADEIRRVGVLARELGVRFARLPAPDAVGLGREPRRPGVNGASTLATVVYIDDDPASLKLVDVLLAREPGFRLVTARSAVEGIAVVARERPDLVFLDLRLPDLDGLAVVERLRALGGQAELPIVLLTGEAEGRIRSLQGKADLLLLKPLDVGRFFEIIALLREEVSEAP